jgi:hypothetical protein
MAASTPGFALTLAELRAVAGFAVSFAEDVLPVFEGAVQDDPRPRAAITVAQEFVRGGPRTTRQRAAAFDAHRAAREAPDESARWAAQAAGDAAAAAYLHPIAQAHQVGHILRAAAGAAYIAELRAGGDPSASGGVIADARDRATPVVVDVLRRYPRAPAGRARTAQLMALLDAELRRVR